MVDLFDRLFPVDSEVNNIAVHSFQAALVDYSVGETTRSEIVNWWTMDSEAQTDLDVLLTEIDSRTPLNKVIFLLEIDAVCLYVEEGAKYTTKSEFRTRLGL